MRTNTSTTSTSRSQSAHRSRGSRDLGRARSTAKPPLVRTMDQARLDGVQISPEAQLPQKTKPPLSPGRTMDEARNQLEISTAADVARLRPENILSKNSSSDQEPLSLLLQGLADWAPQNGRPQ